MPHKRRWAVVAAATVALVGASGIYLTTRPQDADPLSAEFVLGGGTATSGAGSRVEIKGTFSALAVDRHDRVSLFTYDGERTIMWQQAKSGQAKRVPIRGMGPEDAEQAAVTPDGSVYLATGDLWKVRSDGRAEKIVDTSKCGKSTPRATKLADFCMDEVTGVAVADDGTIYIGDRDRYSAANFVHAIQHDRISLVAGREAIGSESRRPDNPAVRRGYDPTKGTKATDVLVTDPLDAGLVATSDKDVYWKTGPSIVRINQDGTLSPIVAGRDPKKISDYDPYEDLGKPFTTTGRAVDSAVETLAGRSHRGDLVAAPGGGPLYYAAGPGVSGPAHDGPFRWGGDRSTSQQQILDKAQANTEAEERKVVYRVAGGNVTAVTGGVNAITASRSYLYLAIESNVTGPVDSAKNWQTAVLRIHMPEQ
ncbi:hypothetical protein [Streptomyces sp. XD-27]|uniref:hypothetical protein n=1 Tax=Streptomyces sp. XD-27 TaxID=3062779 RepID=UPI0026F4347E|nr:hypothetical protein [Streptomyces sp. XD-27]WKX70967.1 hypothetical protein Q3Y56_14560 [Streptomyces sp. XD-27]